MVYEVVKIRSYSEDIPPQVCTHATDQLAANGVLLNHGWEKSLAKGRKWSFNVSSSSFIFSTEKKNVPLQWRTFIRKFSFFFSFHSEGIKGNETRNEQFSSRLI